MRMMNAKQRGQIFAEAGKHGIDNELLHELVYNETGKTSIKQLTYLEAAKVVGRIQGGGAASAKGKKRTDEGGNTETIPMRRKIYMLTEELGWNNDEKRIRAYAVKMTGTDRLEWLTLRQCFVIIEGLKKMVERKNPKIG